MSEIHGRPETHSTDSRATELTITLAGVGLDELRNLRGWLVQEDKLRGQVALIQVNRARGTLGGALEVLSVSLGSGGALSVLVAGIVSWLRQRYGHRPGSTVTVKFRRADGGSFELSADAAGTWTSAELTERIRQLVEALGPGNAPPDSGSHTP
jgi:Effector Associated Constant Component 1